MIDPIPTFDVVLDYMRCYGGTLRLRAAVPGGASPVCNIPAEVAIFAAPTCPGGCMVWGRTDRGWHPNHGERSAVSILLAMLPGKAGPPEEEVERAELPY